jgi:nucleoside-diphosphate-sugar epimerase
MRVMITGCNGKIGRAVVPALRKAAHNIVGLDIAGPFEMGRAINCDCTDFGQVMGALSGIDVAGGRPDAVLHLAGIPMPALAADQRIFQTNVSSTYNVFSAAARLGIKRVVWASSETILGLPFDQPPEFAPIDESHPDLPNWSYALSKQLGETMAEQFVRWHPELSIASLRFSNVFERGDYAVIPKAQARPEFRKWNLWSYVDAEDAADACVLALAADIKGHEKMIIAGPDSMMDRPSAELMAEYFPSVPLRAVSGYASLLSSAKAERIIGYTPKISWRDRVES